MQRTRLLSCIRPSTYRKYSLLLILTVFSPFTFVFLKTFDYRTNHEISSNILQRHYLLTKQKILVPVSIKHLYDYRVVCNGKRGNLDRTNLINQLSKTCRINLSKKANISLSVPDNFEIRSLKSSIYAKSWQTNTSCSLYNNETVAIIMTYRDRKENLRTLLYNLIPLLQRQKINKYKIFIVEQQAIGAFNKGRLYNIGFEHVMKTYKPNCIIFHGIDYFQLTKFSSISLSLFITRCRSYS